MIDILKLKVGDKLRDKETGVIHTINGLTETGPDVVGVFSSSNDGKELNIYKCELVTEESDECA